MADFTLYYWPLPFRGHFVRAVLAHVGAEVDLPDADAVSAMMQRAPKDQPVPFMAPPMLMDDAARVALAQLPAILFHLGDRFSLIPDDADRAALTVKIVNDANDVLDEITLNGGQQMWTADRWNTFRPRLARWMAIWEETGRRHGLGQDEGFLLGGEAPGLADLTTAILWGTMTEKLPALDPVLKKNAPMVHALCRRLMASEPLKLLQRQAAEDYGKTYCGGQIEASLRAVLAEV
ncbi:glutathione S-transferase [Paracoccus sp. TK19116]|uniref:Glutathione S-transferase n=1 Tax=Paracoccus albicereus TaxID=2922394 RepID=A0ABT1MRV7_9RHOB|nr:glutathione S-transferase [Paracoccus albicereus]